MKDMKKRCFKILPLFLLLLSFLYFNYGFKIEILANGTTQTDRMNGEYTFTSTEGETISTVTDSGQTTVLIFGHINCTNSQNTVRNIANSQWVDNPDIRVIFAECNCASLEQTKTFAQRYGSDSIIFCYSENYYNSIKTAMWDYYDLYYDASAGGTLPFTVLMDGKNQIQNVLTGYCTADAILQEINNFTVVDGPTDSANVNLEITGTENYEYVYEILELVNQTRSEKGLPALKLDKELLESAMQRAAEISMYYSHTRPDGTECFTVTNRGTRRSENIAVGYSSAQAVMAAWNRSPGHYQNIVDSYVTSIGIGCFQDTQGIWHWTQLFDNAPAVEPTISGSEQVNRTVSIQKELLHLKTDANQTFDNTEINQTITMNIYHTNEGYQVVTEKLSASNFHFNSSDNSVATVDENGTITLRGIGTTVISASLKEDTSILVEQTITINQKSIMQDITQVEKLPEQTITTNQKSIANVSGLKTASKVKRITLTWKEVSEAEGYLVYQYNSSTKTWDEIASVTSNTPSYTVKKLSQGTTYYFAVKAYLMQDKQQITSTSYTTIYTATNPKAVTFRVTAGKKKATVKWSKVKGATGYRIYYKTSVAGTWKKLKDTKNTNYTKTKLKSGKTYFFTVKAYKNYKGNTYISSGSTKKVTIK